MKAKLSRHSIEDKYYGRVYYDWHQAREKGGLLESPPSCSALVPRNQGLTTRVIVDVWIAPLPVARMPTFQAPTGVPLEAVKVSVELPELPGIVGWTKLAVTPAGKLVAVSVRSPAPPLRGVAVIVNEALPPPEAETVPCEGETVPLKFPPLLTPRYTVSLCTRMPLVPVMVRA